jgi:hypothetical protein
MSLTLLNIGYVPRQEGLAVAATRHSPLVTAVEAGAPALFPFQRGGADAGYRQISQAAGVRDLLPQMQDRQQRVSYLLYKTNPIAFRCVELLVDFLAGEGVSVQAEEPAVQQALEEFWNDPWNNLDQFIPQMVREQSIFGEVLVPCPTNPISGQVRIASIDPMWIGAVEYATLEGEPGRAAGPATTVELRRDFQEKQARRLRIVQPDENPFSDGYGQLRGDAFYWAINRARNATRGISDIFKGADLMKALDEFIWASVEYARHHSAFIWDLKMIGATQEQIADWLKKNPGGPRAGAVRAHNEQVEWSSVSPSLNSSEQNRMVQTLKNMILAGFGFPPHWFAEGGDVNRATALEMGDPALKMLTRRQRDLKYMLEEMLRYVISAKISAGALPEGINQNFEVQMPELSVKDQAKIAAALQTTAQALSLAKAEGWVDEQTAANAVAIQMSQLGVEADPAEMLAKAREEKEAEHARDYRNARDSGLGTRDLGNPNSEPRTPNPDAGGAQ